MTKEEAIYYQQFKKICENPVLWAKAFVVTVNNKTKKKEPWTARWYQAKMLLDKSLKKVARCGRRTGDCLPDPDKLLECQGEILENQQRTDTMYWAYRDWTRGLNG